jgi:hypothetical protein
MPITTRAIACIDILNIFTEPYLPLFIKALPAARKLRTESGRLNALAQNSWFMRKIQDKEKGGKHERQDHSTKIFFFMKNSGLNYSFCFLYEGLISITTVKTKRESTV